jgi:hypothetical protein
MAVIQLVRYHAHSVEMIVKFCVILNPKCFIEVVFTEISDASFLWIDI